MHCLSGRWLSGAGMGHVRKRSSSANHLILEHKVAATHVDAIEESVGVVAVLRPYEVNLREGR